MTRTYRSGEAATVGTDRPFNLHCSHCDTAHALVHTLTDSGAIEMRVYPGQGAHSVTDAAPNRRASMSPTPRRYQTDDDDEAYRDVFDPVTGIIRDGKKIRIGMQTMDAVRPALAPVPKEIRTGLVGEHALKNWFHRDGSPRVKKAAAPPPKKSAADIALDAAMNDPYAGQKPGFRYADADGTTTDARIDAYNLYCDELQNAWKSPERRAQDLRDAQRVDPPKPDDYVENYPGEWQRELSTREMVADSNRPTPGHVWGEDAGIEKEAAQAPPGIWSVGGVPVGLTAAEEGDLCGTDGGRGRLVRRGDFLFCELAPMGSPRIPAVNPSTADAQPGTRAYVDSVWRSYVDEISTAWKSA
jgi:hypothetical protein